MVPEIKEFQGGFLVLLFKGNFNEEHLIKLGSIIFYFSCRGRRSVSESGSKGKTQWY
jgi:hypothetical protein